MWPEWVLNPGPLTFESGALPTALHGPAILSVQVIYISRSCYDNYGISTFHSP